MLKHFQRFIGAGVFTIFLYACGGGENVVPSKHIGGKFNFGYLRYDSAALEYRLDSIHNRGLVMQFCLADAADMNTDFQLIAYAYDTLNDHNNSWMPDTLRFVQDSVPKTFSGKIAIGNNEVTREQLYNVVRDENGERFAYDYLLFMPTVEGVFHHVVYLMKPIKDNKPVPGAKMQMTSPMPPTRNWY